MRREEGGGVREEEVGEEGEEEEEREGGWRMLRRVRSTEGGRRAMSVCSRALRWAAASCVWTAVRLLWAEEPWRVVGVRGEEGYGEGER